MATFSPKTWQLIFFPPNFETIAPKISSGESLGNLKEWAIDPSEKINILPVSLESKYNFLFLSVWFVD